MRHFRWNEPGEKGETLVIDATDDEILEHYFPYWCDQMRQVGKGDKINTEACLEDFVAVHWAWEVQP